MTAKRIDLQFIQLVLLCLVPVLFDIIIEIPGNVGEDFERTKSNSFDNTTSLVVYGKRQVLNVLTVTIIPEALMIIA